MGIGAKDIACTVGVLANTMPKNSTASPLGEAILETLEIITE